MRPPASKSQNTGALALLLLIAATAATAAGCASPAASDAAPTTSDGSADTQAATEAGLTADDAAASDVSAADAPAPDSAAVDAATTDAATTDAATTDAATTDAAKLDAAATDAGTPDAAVTDAGTADAGANDTAVSDASAADTSIGDATSANDALVTDTAGLPGGPGWIPAGQALSGTQYNGGVAFHHTLASGIVAFVEISAPLLPSTKVLYSYENANFPGTQAKMETVATNAALTFDYLLNVCKADYPAITLLPAGGGLLTPSQLQANYNATAECSYKKYTAKPYWIPQLVHKVDICGLKLGSDWRMLNEGDLNEITAADVQVLTQALAPPTGSFWGGFYFSMNVYVRRTDGSLAFAPLAVNPTFKTLLQVSSNSNPGLDKWVNHLEGDWVLRCRRARNIIPAP